MYKASLKPNEVLTGSTKIGKFPPTLFMTKRKIPTVVDLIERGTTSTRMANKIPNHISAEKLNEILFKKKILVNRNFKLTR